MEKDSESTKPYDHDQYLTEEEIKEFESEDDFIH